MSAGQRGSLNQDQDQSEHSKRQHEEGSGPSSTIRTEMLDHLGISQSWCFIVFLLFKLAHGL